MKKSHLLASLSLLTLGALTLSPFISQGQTIVSTDHDVIIIGAGISGLAAATELHANGINDVLIFEARDRIGGRIWTDTLGSDIAVDLGASWIHGTTENPLTELAEENNITTAETDYDNGVLYNSDGEEVEINEDLWDDFQDYAWDYPDTALSDLYEDFIDEEELDSQEKTYLVFLINTIVEHELAGDWSDLSINSFDVGADVEGDDVIFPGGYSQIIDVLAEDINIQLESPVSSVSYGDGYATVTTSTGESLTAKHVISTVPLGVLKNEYIKFSPELPEDKLEAIHLLDMGVLNKTYLLFDEVFWDEDEEFIQFVSDEHGYWTETLNLYPYLGEPILLMFNAAEYGEEIEKKSDEMIIAETLEVLETIYGEAPQPIDSIITRWESDEWSGGSYSYLPKGVDNYVYEELASPIDELLFFAGEATHSDYPATVHGALLSGQRAAEEITDVFLYSSEADGPFNDVNSSHENYDAIEYMYEQNIVEGYSDGTYRPDNSINRAEFTKIIMGFLFSEEEIEACTSSSYTDVGTEWFSGPICIATQHGVVSGYEDGSFQPANEINFAEASKIIANSFSLDISEPTSVWYENYVNSLAYLGAIPTSIDAFDSLITRGEMAEMVYRLGTDISDKESQTYESLGATPNTDISTLDTSMLESNLASEVEDQNMAGLSVLVFEGEDILYENVFSHSDLNQSLDSETIFLIASISKTITATALMQLYDQGEFELTDQINDYLSFDVDHPDWETDITFEMLLTHTSGIADGPSMDDQYYTGQDSPVALSEFMEDYFTPGAKYYSYYDNFYDFEPGTDNEYSNIGSALIAVLVEEISGQDFNTYSKENIFEALNMNDTYWMLEDIEDQNQIATPYEYASGFFNAFNHYTFTDYPNGGLRTTAQDLHAFLLSYQNSTLLEESTINTMHSAQIPSLDPSMGLHWFLMNDEHELWGHDGGEEGVSTNMAYNEDTEIGVILLSNTSDIDLDDILTEAYEFALNNQ